MRQFFWRLGALASAAVIIIFSYSVQPPAKFPVQSQIHIAKDSSLSEIADNLKDKEIIRSPLLFKAAVYLLPGQRSVLAGDYFFAGRQNLYTVVSRMKRGQQDLAKIKVTIPEGSNVSEIAWILLKKLPNFQAPYFVSLAHDSEGYLFPDTYYILPNITEKEIMEEMKANFQKRIASLREDIQKSKRPIADIINMASIIEEEANTDESRKIISGILWKRLDDKMLLQVDAPLVYILGNQSGGVTTDDTKIDSHYNTYKYLGLPTKPISNPGLASLQAAVMPTKSPYWYYLSDTEGNIHYAVDHEGHIANKNKYLK